ncbi:MAG: ribosome biogenesis GTPase Der [Chloroflexi bacterium]|nr:ribosome biogenesis GTPase Der [Chloroflexota bacterium]
MVRPVVAIVGRQNVGKSTLLNRTAGKRVAIVEDLPGTTRDRVFADIAWGGASFTIVDTGGLELKPESAMSLEVAGQVRVAITEADVVIFLVDARSGLTPADQDIADMLRHSGRPVLLVVNKVETPALEAQAMEFYQLGLGEPAMVSAYHGQGVYDMLDRLVSLLPPAKEAEAGPEAMKVAIVGRPNVGKSMLLNTLVGEKRSIVSETPGTTRDSVDALFDFDGQEVLLIDTAGIRRRGRVEAGIERYSVMRALRAIERSDVVLLVLDASEPLTAQDTHIIGHVRDAGKGVVLVVNKWDLVADQDMARWDTFIKSHLKFMTYVPVLYVSAKLSKGIERIIPTASLVYQERHKRLPTSEVNNVVQQAVSAHNPPRGAGRQLKVKYVTQAETDPPTFVFFVNDARLVHFSYQRYLENQLRQAFGFTGTPIRMVFKSRGE